MWIGITGLSYCNNNSMRPISKVGGVSGDNDNILSHDFTNQRLQKNL